MVYMSEPAALSATPNTIDPKAWRFISQIQEPEDYHDAAYWFCFQNDKLAVRPVAERVEIPLARDPGELGLQPLRRQFLGFVEQQGQRVACFSAELDPAHPMGEGWTVDNLRQLYGALGDAWFQLAGRAVQIIDWDRTHQFCGRCGAPMAAVPGERAKRCTVCGLSNYPRLSPAIIIAVTREIEGEKRILLARNHRFPAGRYSVLAGFVEPGESLEECAAREVLEEVAIEIDNIRYFGSQPWPFPNSLMLGFTADYAGGDFHLEDAEIAEAEWFAAHSLPNLPQKPSIARRLIDAFVAENSAA
jgi:NAD+ diphosphatase